MAGVAVLRARDAAEVWVAVPVAPRDTTQMLERQADRVVVLSLPRYFGAVGAWYRDFGQTTDEEVRALLAESRLP
jgi:predicted phosphoribosyltransferase